MNKMVYAGIAVIVIVVIIGLLVLVGISGTGAKGQTTASTTLLTTQYYTNATTTVTTLPNNSSLSNVTHGCAASTYYGCSNISYSAGNGTSELTVTVSQNTGQLWSGYGIGYAPVGANMSGGVPQIAFYAENTSNSSNAGSSLASGTPIKITIPVSGTGSSTQGTIWACYVNSGVLYVGNGCYAQGGGAATYVVIGQVNVSS